MRRFSQRHGLSTLSEINITPLLDLAFVLLIIFIITTPLLDKSSDLIIPTSVAAEKAIDPARVEMISIDRNEFTRLNGRPVPVDSLTRELQELRKRKPGLAVVIRSHKELPVQRVVEIMDALQKAGITRVGVVTRDDAQ